MSYEDVEYTLCDHAQKVVAEAVEEVRTALAARLRAAEERARKFEEEVETFRRNEAGSNAVRERAVRERDGALRALRIILGICGDHPGKRCAAIRDALAQVGVREGDS